jgi:4-aminobutyrate aminotransferase-like enzyme
VDLMRAGLPVGLHLNTGGLPSHPYVKEILDGCLARGMVLGKGGAKSNVLRFKPPLCVTEAQVDACVDAVAAVLREFGPARA